MQQQRDKATDMGTMVAPIINPYRKAASRAENACEMGLQSQRRNTLQDRKYHLAAANKKKKGHSVGQITLFGTEAFDPLKHCEVCKARQWGRSVHRAHHKLCWNNKRTKGVTSTTTLLQDKIDKALQKTFNSPLTVGEKADSRHTTKEGIGAFFTPRINNTKVTPTQKMDSKKPATSPIVSTPTNCLCPEELCNGISANVNNPDFVNEFANARVPLAILALAKVVADNIIRSNNVSDYFTGLTMRVPQSRNMYDNPHYHSIVGQELLLVDWKKMFGLDIKCPRLHCDGELINDRTNFSKNKILFPVFGLSSCGAPSWCMVMSMQCNCCRSRFNANDGAVISNLPLYAAQAYPVDAQYCLSNKNAHIARSATDIFDMIMTTYGNGDLCSRLLFHSVNRGYLRRVGDYYSHEGKAPRLPYIDKDGSYIRTYPPSGDSIRATYDEAASSNNNHWHISDHDRHTREIQGVGSKVACAEDHTHEVTKNYFNRKQLSATALWDMSSETGEIACAVLVPTTKTTDLSHAAIQVSRRPHFNPSALYSDRWPIKTVYWSALFPNVVGRLGLFHFLQRMIKTLRKTHIDYFLAINKLLHAVYEYNREDYDNLLRALREGTLGRKKHSDEDILSLKLTRHFRQRYSKYLRKEIRPPTTMCQLLDEWFVRFKCTANEGPPPLGRVDPITKETLFTADTKDAVRNCKEKAQYLQDPLPLEQMYYVIEPNPNSEHGMREYISRRGESNLEAFHLMLAHFGNCGMRDTLVDNLNLTGTARHNLTIRHKLRLTQLTVADNGRRSAIPAGWETVVPYFNHSELDYINGLASARGIPDSALPFRTVEKLGNDTGERFFSEYIKWLTSLPSDQRPREEDNDICKCNICAGIQQEKPVTNASQREQQTQQDEEKEQTLTLFPPPPAMAQQHQQAAPPMQLLVYQPHQPAPRLWVNPYIMPPSYYDFCCYKYKSYCFRQDKRGRPPHNHWCRHKYTSS